MNTLFTRERIIGLIESERDGFDFIEIKNSKYVLYFFNRNEGEYIEVRLECHYLDPYNNQIEHLVIEHDFIRGLGEKTELDKQQILKYIVEILNKHKLLEGK